MNRSARMRLAQRRRRLIYNDDGYYPEGWGRTEKDFLDQRLNPCAGTQVDSYFWCVGNGFDPPYNRHDPPGIGDPRSLVISAARGAGMEVVASLRMNDCHDGGTDPAMRALMPALKIQRPDLLVASEQAYGLDSILSFTWSAFDYAKEEVRDLRLAYVRELCGRYDWDGIELDFCRFRRYFKLGEEEERAPVMTDFIGTVRAILDEIGDSRGRPYLLAVRVPEDPSYGLARLGLDVRQWLSREYVDVIIGGDGLKPFSLPLKPLIALGHRYDVPVYPCLSCSQFLPHNTGDPYAAERFRAAAGNRWLEAPDGLYLFNFYCLWDIAEHELDEREIRLIRHARGGTAEQARRRYRILLDELGDPRTLGCVDKVYMSEAFPQWVFWQYTVPPNILPVRLIDRAAIPLLIGDALEGLQTRKAIEGMLLRVRIRDIRETENVEVRVNGQRVEITDRYGVPDRTIGLFEQGGGTWFEAVVGAPPLHQGANEVSVGPSIGCWGKAATRVRDVQLHVKYR